MSAFGIYSIHLSQCRVARVFINEARCICYRHSNNNNNFIRLLTTGHTSSNKTTAEDVAAKTAGDDALTADGKTSSEFSGTTAKVIKPRPLFPWRSSPYPLPRLVKPTRNNTSPPGEDSDGSSQHMSDEEYYESDYFTKGGLLGQGWISPMEPWFRVMLFASSMNLLIESWLTVALPWKRKQWMKDMEECFSEAFLRGVSGMMYDTYLLHVSDDERDREESVQSCDKYKRLLHFHDTIRKHKDTAEEDKRRRYLDQNEEHCMLQHNLRKLYQSARDHSLRSDANIVLKIDPVSARIVSMFPVFGLSRSLVQDHPNLRHSYRNLAKRIDRKNKEKQLEGKEKASFFEIAKIVIQGMDDLMENSAKLSDDGNGLITIIAQVAIHCREVFCVKDVATGEVLQGNPDENPRDVIHLVRFEIVIKDTHLSMEAQAFERKPELLVGRWQITDWDDLLDGNVWFT